MFQPGDHAKVERTETFSIDKTNSITLACVVIKDGPCAWTDASQLVRISEEAPAKKSTQSHTKSVQDAIEERPEQPQGAAAKAARPRRGKRTEETTRTGNRYSDVKPDQSSEKRGTRDFYRRLDYPRRHYC